MAKKLMKEIIFPPFLTIIKPNGKDSLSNEDNEMLLDSFDYGSENDFDVICNVVSVLPIEHGTITEVTKEDNELTKESVNHKSLCYYVMNNGCVYNKSIFERLYLGMQQHLKPFFIRAKFENVGVNKVLVDGWATINLMPNSWLKKIGKYDTDLKSHNTILSNYKGKISHYLGVLQVNIVVGTIIRPKLFVVISTNENYNLLLGRECIHGAIEVPSTLHHMISKWGLDEIMENI